MFSKSLKLFSIFLLSSSIISCVHINSVSLTPIPANRSKVVRAEVSKFIILGFNFDNDYINPLVQDLQTQCPNGIVSGILTKDETTSYIFAHTKHVIATGFCQQAAAKTADATRR